MAIRFGNGGYIYRFKRPIYASLDLPITISFWIYMYSIVDGAGIYGAGEDRPSMSGHEGPFWCNQAADNKIRMYMKQNFEFYRESDSGLNTNQWYHFTQVLTDSDESYTMYFYIDGSAQLAAMVPGDAPNGTLNVGPNNLNLDIGRAHNGILSFADFKMEDFAIWNRRLSQHEIEQLASSRKKRMPLHLGDHT